MSGNIVGSIEHYVRGTSFSNYAERLKFIFEYNKVPEESQKSLFITLSGPAVFEELKLLYPATSISTLNYVDIVKKLQERFDKKEPDLIQRYKFYNRSQTQFESAENFVLEVKLQAEFCDFGEFKEIAIRDKLVMGVYDEALQQKLLGEEKLTLATAERIIVNWELAGERAKMISNKVQANGVGSVKTRLGHAPFKPRNSGVDRFDDRFQRSRGRDRNWNGVRPMNKSSSDYRSRSRSVSRNRNYADRQRTEFVCYYCGKRGHVIKKCFKYINDQRKPSVKFADAKEPEENLEDMFDRIKTNLEDSSEDESGELYCMMVNSNTSLNEPCLTNVLIEGKKVKMEVDCGSSVTLMGKQLYDRMFDMPIGKFSKKLVVVNGENLAIKGKVRVEVVLNGLIKHLDLIILDSNNDFLPLLGRDWLDDFFPQWRKAFSNTFHVNNVNMEPQKEAAIAEIRHKFSGVFQKDFSSPIVGFEADLELKNDSPIFKRAYDVPYRLHDKVIEHLEMLEQQNVITPIKTSEWASPVVVVVKKDQQIRLVIDCKVSINKFIIPNSYPIPTAQDIFARLSGCKVFCSLDLEGAYTQLSLSEKSRKVVVINTIKGLFRYNRLPQGATSSAAIFQQVMEQVLQGLKYISVYLDDVLIAGKDFADCCRKLHLVLDRLAKANIKVNWSKCKFFVTKLPYLGHVITENGLLPCPEKISTIKNAAVPKNANELKSFLGLINYYGRFIPKLSSRLHCLYNLLKKDVKFIWDDKCEQAFQNSKQQLLEANILEFYDPNKPIIVVTDASGYGLGGVIAHVEQGIEKPISFTSFSLNKAQRSYPILHLEALALVCSIKKFHKYLYGKSFIVYTDHKPLVAIFGKPGRNTLYVTRLQRYILELSIYNFEIIYRPSGQMGNADFCSRFPLEQTVPKENDQAYVKNINFSQEFPVDFSLVAIETKQDSFLQKVMFYYQHGWPERVDKELLNIFFKSA